MNKDLVYGMINMTTHKFYFNTEQTPLVKELLQKILDSASGDIIEIEYKGIISHLKVGHHTLRS